MTSARDRISTWGRFHCAQPVERDPRLAASAGPRVLGAGGRLGRPRRRGEERRALEWLEAQPDPEITTSGGFPLGSDRLRAAQRPRDWGGRSLGDAGLPSSPGAAIPGLSPRNPAARLVWRGAAPDATTMAALNALAADTPMSAFFEPDPVSFPNDWAKRAKASADLPGARRTGRSTAGGGRSGRQRPPGGRGETARPLASSPIMARAGARERRSTRSSRGRLGREGSAQDGDGRL
jgi:hypothetical protein